MTLPTPYYQDDHVTLYHGDCLELLPHITADVLVTDPPYGIGWRSGGMPNKYTKGRNVRAETRVGGDADTAIRDAALSLVCDLPAIVFGSWKSAKPAGVNRVLVWDKKGQNPGPGSVNPGTRHTKKSTCAGRTGGRGSRIDPC